MSTVRSAAQRWICLKRAELSWNLTTWRTKRCYVSFKTCAKHKNRSSLQLRVLSAPNSLSSREHGTTTWATTKPRLISVLKSLKKNINWKSNNCMNVYELRQVKRRPTHANWWNSETKLKNWLSRSDTRKQSSCSCSASKWSKRKLRQRRKHLKRPLKNMRHFCGKSSSRLSLHC